MSYWRKRIKTYVKIYNKNNSSFSELAQNFESGVNNSLRTDPGKMKPVNIEIFYHWSQKSSTAISIPQKNCKQDYCNFGRYQITTHLGDFYCLASSFSSPFCPREHTSLKYLQKHVGKMHSITESPSVVDELTLSIEETEIAQ